MITCDLDELVEAKVKDLLYEGVESSNLEIVIFRKSKKSLLLIQPEPRDRFEKSINILPTKRTPSSLND